MRTNGKYGAIAVILLSVLLSLAAWPVAAIDHDNGETWTYDVSTSIDVGAYVVDVSGNFTYEFEEERVITVGAREYVTNVMSVNGELSGTIELFGAPFLDASVMIDGFLYEIAGGAGIVKEETNWLIDSTIGSGSAAWAVQYETQTVLAYTPPYLSEFDTESTTVGEQWSEAMNVDKTVTVWENGTIQGTSSDSSDSAYDVVVEAVADSTVTQAGAFDCVKIAITDENGDYEIRWWSEDVNGYVIVESYLEGEDLPFEIMILTSYQKGDSGSMLWVALVGIGVALVAIVVLAIVLKRMRRPKGS